MRRSRSYGHPGCARVRGARDRGRSGSIHFRGQHRPCRRTRSGGWSQRGHMSSNASCVDGCSR
eukprot:2578423-Pyramimonas_sp.AAC.1